MYTNAFFKKKLEMYGNSDLNCFAQYMLKYILANTKPLF